METRRQPLVANSAVVAIPLPPTIVQCTTVQHFLLARSFPLVDAERIALLFASLGITEEAYLRMFARLPSRYREAWLSEMREKGLLSEIQTWSIIDMLDALAAD